MIREVSGQGHHREEGPPLASKAQAETPVCLDGDQRYDKGVGRLARSPGERFP
jgi:hypothetical protein